MATIIRDPLAEREASGADRFDEVWEGVYMMTPWANLEHQDLAFELGSTLREIMRKAGNPGKVFLNPNLSDRAAGWDRNYRVPDIAIFMNTTSAKNHGTHWSGPADFVAEIISPGDKSREKMPFYSKLGIPELVLIDRDPWALELYHLQGRQLQLVATNTLEQPTVISLKVLPLDLRLQSGSPRPIIEIVHHDTGDRWQV